MTRKEYQEELRKIYNEAFKAQDYHFAFDVLMQCHSDLELKADNE